MADPFVGEIRLFPFNFAPKGWAFCAGQLLPISQNTALFSLLGTFYGGNGQSTFALPNLQGNVAVGQGQGPGLSEYFLGQEGGSETITLIASEVPSHTHTIDVTALTLVPNCRDGLAEKASPVGSVQAIEAQGVTATYSSAAPDATMRSDAFVKNGASATGVPAPNQAGGLPHNNLQPYLTLNYCIAMQGVFPPRT